MADTTYTPPPVWSADTVSGGRFASINRPTAGAREDKELPVGEHPLQLYSLATPNGVKATIMLEELVEAGHAGAEYDAWTINIGDGEQFGSGFVGVNPNSKIPALLDRSGPAPFRVFESGAILVHLAEKFGMFLPTDPAARAEVIRLLLHHRKELQSELARRVILKFTPVLRFHEDRAPERADRILHILDELGLPNEAPDKPAADKPTDDEA